MSEIKPVLRQMIDNNKPHWRPATIRGAHKQLDEYEAKAKALDDTLKTLDKLINDDERYKEARSNDFIAGMLIAYENIFNLMEDYIKEGCE